jgi:diacylglycerol O-acyltransferase-1
MYFLGAQYAGPVLKNSVGLIEQGDYVKLMERLLKLSVISVLLWLLMFFALFHCYMNISAVGFFSFFNICPSNS